MAQISTKVKLIETQISNLLLTKNLGKINYVWQMALK